MHEELLTTMARELPIILRQLESGNAVKESAAIERIRDFARMTSRLGAQRVSRRGLLRAGATFAAMTIKPDD